MVGEEGKGVAFSHGKALGELHRQGYEEVKKKLHAEHKSR